MPGKTVCGVSRQEFRDTAKEIKAVIEDSAQYLMPKEFSTGSLGWYSNGKMAVTIGGKVVTCQVGLQLTIVGSKELPK